MFKKSALLVAGLALTGCANIPVGGVGYFDAAERIAVVRQPVVLLPVDTAEPDMTASLTEAVEAAIVESETTVPEIEVAQIDATASAPEPEPETASVTASVTDPAATISTGINTDDGRLDLNATSQAQQKIERDKAGILLEAARAQYVIIEPGALPNIVSGVNIALYARETTNAVGDKKYGRALIKIRFSSVECGKFTTSDDAQRYFLANDGPEQDPLNLDPDGDGFACRWSPEFYRALR